MSQYNQLQLRVWDTSGNEVSYAGLDQAENIQFTQVYPGGKSAGLTFYCARNVTANWSVMTGYRIAAYNGLNMVWEGYITGITPSVGSSQQGMSVIAEGVWTHVLQRRKTRKPWADTRIDEATMPPTVASAYPDRVTIDRQSHIKFSPKIESWAIAMYAQVVYTAPIGHTIKRVTFSYDLQEGAQNWSLYVYNVTAAATLWSVGVSGASTYDSGAIATPTTALNFYFQNTAGVAQTPTGPSGTIYGRFWDIVVYTETGAINAQTITTKIASLAGGLSTDVSQIGAETVSLVPFIANGAESYADLLARVAGYGDASFNKWATWVDLSENAADSLPRLVLEQQPVLTSYDYAIRMDDPNVSGDLQFIQDLEPLRNWVAVQYQDVNGRSVYVTPDDDATLKDVTSITAYGQRDEWLQLNTTSLTAAKNFAKRFLAARKDLQWTTVGQLAVTGYIRGSSGQAIATSQIQAGKCIRIENWLNDLSGSGLTFLITGTTYSDSDERCGLDIGLPNTLEVQLLRLQK